MRPLVHLIAHTRDGDRSLIQPERGSDLWARLRTRVPGLLVNCLMPNHIHSGAFAGSLHDFKAALMGFTRRFGVRFDVLAPEPARTHAIARRMFRYIHLNPVRAGLVRSPASWLFSTTRELFDAAAEPVATREEWVRVLGIPEHRLVAALSRLDNQQLDHVPDRLPVVATIDAAVRATASAFRLPISMVMRKSRTRRVAMAALREVGATKAPQIAAAFGCAVRTVYRAWSERDPAVTIVLRCLGDPRLRTCAEDL